MKKIILVFLLIELFSIAVFFLAPSPALAQAQINCPGGGPPPPGYVCLQNPLGFLNVQTPGELVVKAFAGFAAIIAALAIAFTVFSGFKMIIASTEEAIKAARASLTWAVGGFIASLLSFTLIAATAKFLGFQPALIGQDQIQNPILIPGDTAASRNFGPSSSFIGVMNFVMINFLGIIGFATTLMIIYYGYRYLTSAGNEEAVEKAKQGLKWSLLGFAVSILAYTIINSVQSYLRG